MNRNTLIGLVLVIILVVVVALVGFPLLSGSGETNEAEEIKEFTVSSGDTFGLCVGQQAKLGAHAIKFLSGGDNPKFEVSIFGEKTTLVFEPGRNYYAMLLNLSVSKDPEGSSDCVLMTWDDEFPEVEPGEFSVEMSEPVQVKGTSIKLIVFPHPAVGNALQVMGSSEFVQENAVPGKKVKIDGFVVEYLGFTLDDNLNKFNVYEEGS